MKNEIETQYRAVREAAGYYKRPEMGWIAVHGADRLTWLQGMVSNDTRLLAQGIVASLPACLLNATGHLVSDMTLINVIGKTPFVLIDLPRANTERVHGLLDRYIIMEDVTLEDWKDHWTCLTLQGPQAEAILSDLRPLFQTAKDSLGGAVEAAANHTGSGGWDIFAPSAVIAQLINDLQKRGIMEIGTEAQEILRVEAGLPKFGADMDETTIALEAGLGPTHISMTKGCYVGQEIIARIDSRGHTNRALTGFLIEAGELPNAGDKIYGAGENGAERETGRITSAIAKSPAMNNRSLALGYARHEHREPNTFLTARSERGETRLRVIELPFYPRNDTKGH